MAARGEHPHLCESVVRLRATRVDGVLIGVSELSDGGVTRAYCWT